MTETIAQTTTYNIPELEKARSEASRHERQLAQEVDSLPEKIQQAAKRQARDMAHAARTGEDIAAVDDASEVNALRKREAELPLIRWSAALRTASLEVELNQAQKEREQEKADEARPNLKPAREEMDAASERFNEIRNTVRSAEYAVDVFSGYVSKARKSLAILEQEYPSV